MEATLSKKDDQVSQDKDVPTGVIETDERLDDKAASKKNHSEKRLIDSIGTTKSLNIECRPKTKTLPRSFRTQKITERRLLIILLVLIGLGLIAVGLLYGLCQNISSIN